MTYVTGKKRFLIGGILLCVLIVTLRIMSATGENNSALSPVSGVIREVMQPIQTGITSATKQLSDFFAFFSDNKKLRQENEKMKQRITELEENLYDIQEKDLENQRLKELLGYKEEKIDNYQLLLAKIIGRSPNNWYTTITIDKGSNQGVKKDMPIVNHEGLVGRVINVTKNTAEVLLLLDSEGAVGGRVFENRVTPGVVTGTGKEDSLKMLHLPHDVPIEKGHTIVTSGLGEMYPPGIRIGTVTSVNLEPSGLIKTAIIKPAVDFSRLEEVFVILQVFSPEADGAETSQVQVNEE